MGGNHPPDPSGGDRSTRVTRTVAVRGNQQQRHPPPRIDKDSAIQHNCLRNAHSSPTQSARRPISSAQRAEAGSLGDRLLVSFGNPGQEADRPPPSPSPHKSGSFIPCWSRCLLSSRTLHQSLDGTLQSTHGFHLPRKSRLPI